MIFVAFITFLVTVGVLMVLVYASGPKVVDIGRRLSRVLKTPGSALEEDLSASARLRPQNVFVSIGQMIPAPKGKKASQDQILLIRAGIRSQSAVIAIRGMRLLGAIGLFVLVIWTGLISFNPIAVPVIAAVLGWYLPDLWLSSRVKARQKRLRLALPDAMDLLVICVEVGLGLDQALLKVADEIQTAHPALGAELHLVNLEMRVGKTRLDALRELAQRTGLDDIKVLVGILVQTDRFGTSIVDALHNFSDELRTKRRQRAEEMGAKVSVKMVPVLVFFIFPALMAVILAPAILSVMRNLLPNLK
jgi:tight adherence protein C